MNNYEIVIHKMSCSAKNKSTLMQLESRLVTGICLINDTTAWEQIIVTVHLRVIHAAPPCFTSHKRARFTPMFTKAALETKDYSFT